jgi:putative transposase
VAPRAAVSIGIRFRPVHQGSNKGLALHSQTVQAISVEYAIRRKQAGKTRLRWRALARTETQFGLVPIPESVLAVAGSPGRQA